jgi:hypothetical protein
MTNPDLEQIQPQVSDTVYKQWCEDFRAINEIFWRVPVIAMTLTGGIAFGVGSLKFSQHMQSAMFYFLALCNFCFIVIVWRLRLGVMESLLRRIHKFEGRVKPRMSYAVVAVFTMLFGITAIFSVYAASHRDAILLPQSVSNPAPSPSSPNH